MTARWQPSPALRRQLLAVTTNGRCEECGDIADEHGSCFHDGRILCRCCLHRCPTCLDAIKDGFYGA